MSPTALSGNMAPRNTAVGCLHVVRKDGVDVLGSDHMQGS